MELRFLALLLVLPPMIVFVYAGWKEHERFRKEGKSTYGLTYDPESNTTYVDTIAEGDESYDLEEYVPEPNASDEIPEHEVAGQTDEKDHPDQEQDDRT